VSGKYQNERERERECEERERERERGCEGRVVEGIIIAASDGKVLFFSMESAPSPSPSP
jgi:hypothetical protein